MSLKVVSPRPGKTPFYYVRGTFAGRLINASTKERNKKGAEVFKAKLETELAKRRSDKYLPATFRTAVDLYIDYRQPKPRDKRWIDKIVTLLGDHELADIRQHTIIDTANKLFPIHPPATKNRQVIVVIASILHYAAENNLCPYIRVRKFKERAPEPRALSKDHARALIAGAEGKMRLILVWLFFQGWRISDTLRLQWNAVDLVAGNVRYHISKTDEWRIMPLHAAVIQSLVDAIPSSGRVFPWQNKSNFYRALRPLCRRLNVKFTPHMARHSFATWLVNEGVSTQEIMEAGGWRDHKSVLRYAKLDPARVRRVINTLDT